MSESHRHVPAVVRSPRTWYRPFPMWKIRCYVCGRICDDNASTRVTLVAMQRMHPGLTWAQIVLAVLVLTAFAVWTAAIISIVTP